MPDDDRAVERLAAEVSGREVENDLGAARLERERPSEGGKRPSQSKQQGDTPHVQVILVAVRRGRRGRSRLEKVVVESTRAAGEGRRKSQLGRRMHSFAD